MAQAKRKIPVQTLAGLGVPGAENDPPLFHFDLTGEELQELLADPARFVEERLDYDQRQRAARPSGRQPKILISDLAWDGSGWGIFRPHTDPAEPHPVPLPPSCVYDVADEMHIHTHTGGPHTH
jgi:hypothetical protein